MCTGRRNTNNSNCSCSGHDIPQYGILHHVIACCDVPHYDNTHKCRHGFPSIEKCPTFECRNKTGSLSQ